MSINHRYALSSGSLLHGVYRIQRVLGSGTFGITYLAQHVNLGSRSVIKEYLPEFAVRDNGRVTPPQADKTEVFNWGLNSFFQEAKILHGLNHTNIVKVSDLFEENGTAYFVMPYMGSNTFLDWIASHSTPTTDELNAIFLPILDGLSYIHARDLLHRDIKPANILLTADGTPVLIDFGSARFAINSNRPQTNLLTPNFAPIEQYGTRTTHYKPSLDIYSLSASLYQAITGKLVEAAPDRLQQDLQPKLAHNPSYRHLYPHYFLDAIDKGLSVQPENRFQTALDMKRALSGQNQPSTTTSTTTVVPPRTQVVSPQTQMVSPATPPKTKPQKQHKPPSHSTHQTRFSLSGSLKKMGIWIKRLISLSIISGVALWSYPHIKDWLQYFNKSSGKPYHGTAELKLKGKTVVYTGWLQNGVAQDNTGNATLKFDDGTECKVGMLNNERNGMGKCSYPKGSMYDGSWKNDMKHGYGKYIPAESSPIASYEGGFVRDKLSGKGMMKYKNNAVYVGEFANDNIKINSKGEITGMLGMSVRCVGTFTYKQANCSFKQGNSIIKYKGGHKNGLWNGFGEITTFDNGEKTDSYRGTFRNGDLIGETIRSQPKTVDSSPNDSTGDDADNASATPISTESNDNQSNKKDKQNSVNHLF